MPKPEEAQALIESTARDAMALERQVAKTVATLKDTQDKITAEWKTVEQLMIDNGIKSIKGEWGSLTIAEKLAWDYDASLLPGKFFKKVVDTAKLSATYRLEGKPPKAAFPRTIKFLQRRIK